MPDKGKTPANGQPASSEPPNPEGTAKATEDNDLTTGHGKSGDGGDNNAKPGTKT
jgi:hypothetical protein